MKLISNADITKHIYDWFLARKHLVCTPIINVKDLGYNYLVELTFPAVQLCKFDAHLVYGPVRFQHFFEFNKMLSGDEQLNQMCAEAFKRLLLMEYGVTANETP